MTEWRDFFVAQAGASAALAGLIFVGISISLDQLIKYSHLLLRAAAALTLLASVLITSTLMLTPQPTHAAGLEVIGVGLLSWVISTGLKIAGVKRTPASYRHLQWVNVAFTQIATIPVIIGGIILATSETNGLYWLVPAFIACFVISLLDGWVLLVEIHR